MKSSDCWRTPDWLYKQLDEEFHFDIDLCATEENKKCDLYCSEYLHADLENISEYYQYLTCFMNPPYSNPLPFIKKAWEDAKHCKIVCLVKVDPSTKWWGVFWNYEGYDCHYCEAANSVGMTNLRDCSCEDIGPKPGCEVRFLPKRIKFEHPDFCTQHGSGGYRGDVKWCFNCEKPCKTGGNFASAIVIMDRRNEQEVDLSYYCE